jgi:hypothetical protein
MKNSPDVLTSYGHQKVGARVPKTKLSKRKASGTPSTRRRRQGAPSSKEAGLAPDILDIMDPYGFHGGTRAVTLNLPTDLWNKLDAIAPSRGKNKFFIALLVRYLREHGHL